MGEVVARAPTTAVNRAGCDRDIRDPGRRRRHSTDDTRLEVSAEKGRWKSRCPSGKDGGEQTRGFCKVLRDDSAPDGGGSHLGEPPRVHRKNPDPAPKSRRK